MKFPMVVIFLKVLVLCVGLTASALGAAVSESPFVSAVPLELEEEGEDYQADYDYEYSDPTTVDSFTTQEDTTTTSQPLLEGQIAWAPYSMMRADKVSPVNLPSYHTGMTLPPIKGRWLSRNKDTVQLINTKPAFIYPQVPLLDQEKKEEEVRSSRVRRGSGSYTNNNHVALCGGVFRDLYGIIQSPEYPLYYPNNKVGGCMTEILVLSFMFLLAMFL